MAALCSAFRLFASAALVVGASGALAQDAPISIFMVGDNALHGYGEQNEAERMPAQLKTALLAEGHAVEIIESPNFDTSKGGVIWLRSKTAKALLANPENSVVIVGLGQHDCGQLELDQTEANLDTILATFAERAIPTLLVARKTYEYCTDAYAAAYPLIFPELAERHGSLLYVDEAALATIDRTDQGVNFVEPAVAVEGLLPRVLELVALRE